MTAAAKYETRKATKSVAKLVQEREEHRAQIAELARKVATIDDTLDKLEPGIVYDTPTHTFLRRPTRRFNAAKFAEKFPATKKPKLYKRTLDTTAVKRAFSAAELAAFEDVSYATIVAPKEA